MISIGGSNVAPKYYDDYLDANRKSAASGNPNYSDEYLDANRKNAQKRTLAQNKKSEIAAREASGTRTGATSRHAPGEDASFGNQYSRGERTTFEEFGGWGWMATGGAKSPKNTAARGTIATVTTRTPAGSSASARAPRIFSKKMKNRGWNSWARSIEPLTAGNYLLFTVGSGGEGSLLAIAPMGWEGRNIARFSHALIADVRGIKVYEYGQIIATIKSSRQASSLVRIHRQADNSIVYVVTTGTETIVHTSNEPLPYHIGKNVYTYGMLYSSDDRVTSSAFESGVVQYGSV